MSFNGSGVAVINSTGQPVSASTLIEASVFNAFTADVATMLSTAICKDGQTTVIADLPMATYRHTGVGNASARTDYAAAGQVQDGKLNWVDGGGTADAITATYSPVITELVDGQLCFVRATAANATTTPTFAPNGLTARTIVRNGGAALVAGAIVGDGHELILRYDLANTRWELLNSQPVIGTDVQAYDADIPTVSASQGEMEAGTEAALRSMSPLRVAQAIAALVPASSGAPTGSVFDYVGSTEPSGYVFLSGKTIGNGASGGTARANADTSALFTLLWDSMANSEAAVSGGRGANAAADFAANKTITLPDARGRTIAGKDNMGGTTASRLTNGGSGITATTLGVSGGTETHTLSTAQLASHSHSHAHVMYSGTGGSIHMSLGGDMTDSGTASGAMVADATTAGSGSAHQNTQPTLVLNKIIKL